MVCFVGSQEEKGVLKSACFFYLVLDFSNISSRKESYFWSLNCRDFVFILLRFRFDGLFGRFPTGKVFLKVLFFYIVLDFSNILVGILFVEPDLQGVRVHFVAFSIRWFVL